MSSAQDSGRMVSVYAPVHICIAWTHQLVYDIREGLDLLMEKYKNKIPSFITLATGPSRTADIEKTLVVGVHGPKDVYVFLVDAHELYLPMQIAEGKKIFFISDFHLGSPDRLTSLQREKYIIRFLESIQHEAAEIFIVGDLFDFWFEYKTVVPKGYVRILGKLATLTDAGIPIQFFVGNHDMWMKNYFEKELSIPVYYEPKTICSKRQKIFDWTWGRTRTRGRWI